MVWGWMDNWYILGSVIVVAAALLLDWIDGRRRARHAKQNRSPIFWVSGITSPCLSVDNRLCSALEDHS